MRGYKPTPRDIAVLDALKAAGPGGATARELGPLLPDMDYVEIGLALRALRERGEVKRRMSGFARSRGNALWELARSPVGCIETSSIELFSSNFFQQTS